MKTDIRPVSGQPILDSIDRLHISYVRHTDESDVHLHVADGEFRTLFGVGEPGRWIYPGDADGVTLVALQELHRYTERLGQEQLALSRQMRELLSRAARDKHMP